MPEIINLRMARKARARAAEEQRAAENRVKFGRTLAEKQKDKADADRARRVLDNARREHED